MVSDQAAELAYPRFVMENWPRLYDAKCVTSQKDLVGFWELLRRDAPGAVVIGWPLTCLTTRLRGSDGLGLALGQFDVATVNQAASGDLHGGSIPRDRRPSCRQGSSFECYLPSEAGWAASSKSGHGGRPRWSVPPPVHRGGGEEYECDVVAQMVSSFLGIDASMWQGCRDGGGLEVG